MTAKFSKEARRAVNTGTLNQVTIFVFNPAQPIGSNLVKTGVKTKIGSFVICKYSISVKLH